MEKIYTITPKADKWYKYVSTQFCRKLFYLNLMFLASWSSQLNAQNPCATVHPVTATITAGATSQCDTGAITVQPSSLVDNTVWINESFNLPANTAVWTKHKDAIHETGGENFVKLTENQNDKNGQLLFAKTPVAPKAFEFQFRAFMSAKDGADGFSVNYAEIGNVESLQEDGSTTGLALRFKTFGTDKVQLFYNNAQIGIDYNFTTPSFILEDGGWHTYTFIVDVSGKAFLHRDGTYIFANLQLPTTFLPTPDYQWAFAGRTGGSSNQHIIDDVKFTDKTPILLSRDSVNFKTSTMFTSFTNIPAGPDTVYAKTSTGCVKRLGIVQVNGATPRTPTFTQVQPICKGATLNPLPTSGAFGLSSVPGTWAPAINNMATTTYTFTPTSSCDNTATMTIEVNELKKPTFTQVPPSCNTVEFTQPTQTTSPLIAGNWLPEFNLINTKTTRTYTFTPTVGQGCVDTASMTIVRVDPIAATMIRLDPICKGATVPALPPATNLSPITGMHVTGTWDPATINNMATTTYVFRIPFEQCVTSFVDTIEVVDCSVASGKVFQNANTGTIGNGGTSLSVGGTYLSIYSVGTPDTLRAVVPVTAGTGAYTFPPLPYRKYKIVIGTSAAGSPTPSYPTVNNVAMTSAGEGKAGTTGDGTPDGITYVTLSAGEPVHSGSRGFIDAGVDFALRPLSALPVKLVSFSGENTAKGNLLNWQTASEVNNSHFDIERSVDGIDFTSIDKVNGNGTTEIMKEYTTLDESPIIGTNYYRLKQVDYDGQSSYSDVISVSNDSDDLAAKIIYPNPALSEININVKEETKVVISDMFGRIVKKTVLDANKTSISLADLISGIYTVTIGNQAGIKLVKE